MTRLALILLLIAAPAGAQVSSPPHPARTPMPPPAPDVMYSCPAGTDFVAHFSPDGELATLRIPGQPDIELPRARAGTGFAYSDSYYELRGRGREATLTAAGRAMRCHAAGRPGEPPRTFEGPGLTLTLFPDGTFRLQERKTGSDQTTLDIGQWSHEVEGGVRLVLRGGDSGRRAYREAATGNLVADDGSELILAAMPNPIDGRYRLAGMYRDAQDGGLFAACLAGRTYAVAPGGAEPDLERAWVEATPSRDSSLYVEIVGRFAGPDAIAVDEFLSLKRDGACPPLSPRGAALRDTEWRMVEIDGTRPDFDDWRRRPVLRLDEAGKFTALTGCNNLSGDYVLDPDGLRFVPGPMTMIGCPQQAIEMEKRFVEALAAVRTAQIAGTTLDLSDGTGKRRLRLDARGR
jgi:heat shock protein HslJ/membrane-bound inhibitor of C-type lysozyme